jgi:hypothetical protein
MNQMNSLPNEQTTWWRIGIAKLIGHVLASMSLTICLTFWFGLFYAGIAEKPILNFTGFEWLKIMGFAVALAAIATVFRSKLCYVALPLSLFMFFFTMYVMGS